MIINEKKNKEKEKKNKKRIRRTAKIVNWYIQGLTYEQVGKKFRITRERVRQILNIAKNEGLNFEIRGRKYRGGTYETRTCICGNSFEVYIPKGGTSKRETCSQTCRQKYRVGYKYKSPEEARIARRTLSRERYYNDPEYRKRGDKARHMYYLKTRHDPKHIARQKIYSKRYYESIRHDPIKLAKYKKTRERNNKEHRIRYHQIKTEDPKKYLELRQADSRRQKIYFIKLRQDPVRWTKYCEKKKIEAREKYRRIKADPKLYRGMLAATRRSYQQRKLKNTNGRR